MKNVIDTVHIRYDFLYDTENKYSQLKTWLSNHYLEKSKEIIEYGYLPEFRYKIKNLEISLTSSYLFIRGSILKYYIGNNIESIDFKDIYKAFNKLNDDLGNIIDVKSCYVRRLDLGVNLIMSCKPEIYINKLHSSTNSKKDIRYFGQTIIKGNKSRCLIAYDKTEETQKQNKKDKLNIIIPDNVLRLEARITGRHVFEKHFGVALPTLSTVLESNHKFSEIIKNEYNKLVKEYDLVDKSITKTSDIYHYAMRLAGYDKLTLAVNYSYESGLLNYQEKYRITNTIKSVFEAPTSTSANSKYDLITELDTKVHNWYIDDILL